MKEWGVKTIIVIAGIFAPVKGMLFTVGVLIVADMITGVLAARKRGEEINSGGLKRTIIKALIYEAAVMLGFLTETFLTGGTIPISNIIASLVGMTELLSVLENMNDIGDNPVLKSIIDKLSAINEKTKNETDIKK